MCPPENTFTSMNFDLVKSENSSLDKNVRDDLESLYSTWLQDEEFAKILDEQNSFKEERKYRNWYLGYSKVTMAYEPKASYGTALHDYTMHTTATEGTVSSPWFGQHFAENRFIQPSNLGFQPSWHTRYSWWWI